VPWVDRDDDSPELKTKVVQTPGAPQPPKRGKWVDKPTAATPATQPFDKPKMGITAGPGGKPQVVGPFTQPYDPERAQEEALQEPTVDPVMTAAMMGTGGVIGGLEGGVKAGVTRALEEGASWLGLGAATKAVEPLAKKMEPYGAFGKQGAWLLRQGAGLVGGAAPGLARGGLRMLTDMPALERAAMEAREKQVAEGTKAAERMAQVKAQAKADVEATYEKEREKALKTAQQEAREETISGKLKPPGGQEVLPAGPAREERGQQFETDILGGAKDFRTKWGVKRDRLLRKHVGDPADDSALQEQIFQEESTWNPANRNPSPKVRSFIAQAKGTQNVMPDDDQLLKTITEPKGIAEAARTNPRLREQVLKQAKEKWASEHADVETRTVGELLKLQQEAKAMSRAATSPIDKTALDIVSDGIDASLANLDSPELKALNRQYWDHRKHFPFEFERKVRQAARPADAYAHAFDDPERMLDIINMAPDKETKGRIAQYFSDYSRSEQFKNLKPEDAQSLRKLFGNTVLSKPESLVYEAEAEKNLARLFRNSPNSKVRYDAAIAAAKQRMQDNFDSQVLKEADRDSQHMGVVGADIRRQIAATPPEQRAKKALELMEKAASAENQQMAGVAAIQGYDKPTAFYRRWNRWGQRYLMITGISIPMGASPRFAEIGAAAYGAIVVREQLANAWKNAYKDPEEALKLYNALINPGKPGSLDRIADAVIRAEIMRAAITGPSAFQSPSEPKIHMDIIKSPEEMRGEEKPKKEGPGPMSQAIERKTAEAIATDRGKQDVAHVENIQDLNMQIASGKVPNIHRALSAGRLSTGEVRKMLDSTPTNAGDIFEAMSLDDAFEAFSRGGEDEKAVALPALAQKLQNEGQNLPPEQRRVLMAKLRTSLGGAPEEAVG